VVRRPASVVPIAVATLLASGLAARRHGVSAGEAATFRAFNHGPDAVKGPVWLVMQSGSLAAVGVAAAATARRHGRRPAAVVLATGTGVWAGVKLVKPLVGRGRPAAHLDDVVVRGAAQNGLGYPSGHAAVATTLALTTTGGGPARAIALAAAACAGCGRMYAGAHLPLDVVGGFAIGTLAGHLARRTSVSWARTAPSRRRRSPPRRSSNC
jgi:undecaprenyl-diphosphatase